MIGSRPMKAPVGMTSVAFAWVSLAAMAVGLAAAPAPAGAPAKTPAGLTEPKTHTLFMGADITVEHEKTFYHVEGVVGGSFIIKVNGKDVKVAADWGSVKLKVDRSLKLTKNAVQVDKLRVDRAYTPANDPVKQFMNSQGAQLARQDAIAAAQVNLGNASRVTVVPQAGGRTEAGFGAGDPVKLEQALTQQFNASLADAGNYGSQIGRMQEGVTAENFDALEIRFEVSAPRLVRNPYVVIMAQYRSPQDKPGNSLSWIYAAALNPLEGERQKVSISRGGFPPGFILEKSQVHIYDGAQELASNIADNRVELSDLEAFTFLSLDYLGNHKGATLPPAVAMGRPSREARSQLDPDQLGQTYYVKVTKDGMPVAAFTDAACTKPVGELPAALIAQVRFFPALEQGKPVAGVAEFRMTHLNL